MNRKSIVYVVLVFALLFTPLINTLFIKKDAQDLIGVSNETVIPQYDMKSAFNGEFQNEFENSFSKGFSGYKFAQRLLNEIRYRVFNSVDNITVCKNNELIFESYIQEYLGLSEEYVPSDESINAFTEQIITIKQLAESKDKRVVVLITPSKADYIADDIPKKYYRMQRYGDFDDRGYIKLKAQLTEAGIPVVCSSDILNASECQYEIFPDTGIHWTRESALTVYNELASVLEQEGINLQRISVTSRVTENSPRTNSLNNDADLFALMNVLSDLQCEYTYPIEESIAGDYDKPAIFIQGDSFTFTLKEIIRDHNIASDCDFLFYNMSYYDENNISYPVNDLKQDNIVESVLHSDLIILEVNEQSVYNMGAGTYDSIIEILSDGDSDILYGSDIEYVAFNNVESYNGVKWRWSTEQYSSVVHRNLPSGSSLNCRIWIPYSALVQLYTELDGKPANIDIYVNGELYDRVSCQQDEIFDIRIPSDKLLPNADNIITFYDDYGIPQSDGKSYYFQILGTWRED